ncbi:acyl-CoA thioesterase [Gudongella sp. DL1XJH-153]|uniref:acyl-CoA thioesterase n=1 Tax=Gudongella sp. DL1XJH-153 TaxID=3409804 RepID=UPI003BB63C0D
MKSKTVDQSKVSVGHLMQPDQANIEGNVHGGEVMKLMDSCAGIVARRHSRRNTVTAMVDELEFMEAIHVGELVTCYGQLTYVGKQSMEVLVTVSVEDLQLSEPPKVALTAFFTMVALDINGNPTAVPELELKTDEEKRLFKDGEIRYLKHKNKREKRKEGKAGK